MAYPEIYQTLQSWGSTACLPKCEMLMYVRTQLLQLQRLPGRQHLTLHEDALWLPEQALSCAAGRQQHLRPCHPQT